MNNSDTSSSSVSSSNRPLPIGPDFFNSYGLLHDNIIDEYLLILSSENTEVIRQFDEESFGFFICTEAVQHIFTICARLRLPEEVKYQALDIFDRFMSLQTLYSYEIISKSDKKVKEKHDMWSNSYTTMSRQLTLRMCSAIQIASKLQSFHDSLSKVDVKKALVALGFPCTEEMIQKSELRILQILNFNVEARRSPSQCLESYLSLLVRKHNDFNESVDHIYRYGLFTLDFVFLNKDEVYTAILKIVHSTNPIPITKSRIRRVSQDYCLLGAAACLIGIICTLGESISTELLPDLSEISLIAENDISDTVNGILTVMASNV